MNCRANGKALSRAECGCKIQNPQGEMYFCILQPPRIVCFASKVIEIKIKMR